MQKILIVIDMQNDFVTGSLGSEAAQVAAKNIAAHINEDVLTEKRKPTRKLYYNILLDDRAGLGSAYTALDMLYSKLEAEGELKTWRT